MNRIESDYAGEKKWQANLFNHLSRHRWVGILFGVTIGWGSCFVAAARILDGRGWDVENWTLALVSCLLALTLIMTIVYILRSNHKLIAHK